MIDETALHSAVRSGSNLLCCVDGGRRGDGQAACGIVLYEAQRGEGRKYDFQRIACIGKSDGILHSAFLAETCSLELALDFLADILD